MAREHTDTPRADADVEFERLAEEVKRASADCPYSGPPPDHLEWEIDEGVTRGTEVHPDRNANYSYPAGKVCYPPGEEEAAAEETEGYEQNA